MSQISVVIISWNEEKNIGRCLASIHDWVDEIVVVDSGSTDGTQKICSRYSKVQWYERAWLGYGPQKNYGNSLARGSYILSLDADEEVSQELREQILAVGPPWRGVYGMNRRTQYLGTWVYHCGWYPDIQWRFFPKDENLSWSGDPVHERLLVPASLSKIHLKGDLFHYPYSSPSQYWQKLDKYSDLGAEKVSHRPKLFLVFQMILNPLLRFIKTYFFQRGVLQGSLGLQICVLTAYGVFRKYQKALVYPGRPAP